jgi:hypothetical protein
MATPNATEAELVKKLTKAIDQRFGSSSNGTHLNLSGPSIFANLVKDAPSPITTEICEVLADGQLQQLANIEEPAISTAFGGGAYLRQPLPDTGDLICLNLKDASCSTWRVVTRVFGYIGGCQRVLVCVTRAAADVHLKVNHQQPVAEAALKETNKSGPGDLVIS